MDAHLPMHDSSICCIFYFVITIESHNPLLIHVNSTESREYRHREENVQKRIAYGNIASIIHRNFSRAHSSIAVQIRSEHIDLNSYLYQRKVPGLINQKFQSG